MKRTSGAVMALGALVMAFGGARAAVLCTAGSGSGTVRVREACRPREVQLDPVALGLQGPPGPRGLRGPAMTWVDANGAFVGLPSAAAAGDDAVMRLPNSDFILVRLNEAGFESTFD